MLHALPEGCPGESMGLEEHSPWLLSLLRGDRVLSAIREAQL